MKLKQLESLLGDLNQFSEPKVELEQYPTSAHIASRMIYTAENSFEDISGKIVADFGCGCGTLGIASALLGAEQVLGIDIDPESLEIAGENATDLEVDVDFIQCDLSALNFRGQLVDTVVMNPPFGTRKKGSDMEFLSLALKECEFGRQWSEAVVGEDLRVEFGKISSQVANMKHLSNLAMEDTSLSFPGRV